MLDDQGKISRCKQLTMTISLETKAGKITI